MNTTLDRVLEAVEARQAEADERFNSLAAEFAAGGEPAPADVADTLAAARKSGEDLRREVDRLQQRQAAKALIGEEPGLLARQAELKRQVEAADAAFREARDRHRTTIGPLHAELDHVGESWYRRRRDPRYQGGSDPQGGRREVEVRTGSPLGTGHLKTAELRLAEAGCCRA